MSLSTNQGISVDDMAFYTLSLHYCHFRLSARNLLTGHFISYYQFVFLALFLSVLISSMIHDFASMLGVRSV